MTFWGENRHPNSEASPSAVRTPTAASARDVRLDTGMIPPTQTVGDLTPNKIAASLYVEKSHMS